MILPHEGDTFFAQMLAATTSLRNPWAPKARHQRGTSLMLNQILLQKPEAWVIAPELPRLRQIEDQVREAHRAPLVAGRATHQHASRTILWFREGLSQ